MLEKRADCAQSDTRVTFYSIFGVTPTLTDRPFVAATFTIAITYN